MFTRRDLLKVLGAGAAGATLSTPLLSALAAPEASSDEFFILIHANGGWDVTLWSDPRYAPGANTDPATDELVDIAKIKHWKPGAAVPEQGTSYAPIKAGDLVFGPGIGDLLDHASKLTLFNGIAMETVSHQDGSYYSATGRHLAGGRPAGPSINTALANEFSAAQLLPNISIGFPSTFIGSGLDLRVLPLRVNSISTMAKALTRSNKFTTAKDRDAVTLALADEAAELAALAHDPAPLQGMSLQFEALRDLLASGQQDIFDTNKLKVAQPAFDYKAEFQANMAVNAAFAIEAFKANMTRCVSFSSASFDTHNSNYQDHALMLQEFFNTVARLVENLETTPHPTKAGAKLADHTHILVFSEFCRTPQINLQGGRDHYPNNSALVISPRFQGGKSFGKSRASDMLPDKVALFGAGKDRPVAPFDILTTFVSAFGVDPRKYLRDGDVIKAALKA